MPQSNESIPTTVTAAGFGKNPNIPSKTRPMQVVNLTYQETTGDRIVTNTTGSTICLGDSGGPLFKTNGTHYVLLGISSTNRKENCSNTPKKSEQLVLFLCKNFIYN
ncbi:hypothetical protein DICVIV_01697 [Dictyocaulus viviparus]|uniref:Peptidase S1 domain-containing protein n=1 Tax=Dictyocaulus viviparus TaxID=29172 RepID=A0A0D8Y5G7_DICVI|nr:hypothetical protein DICVIV_01697 [Dictyocaulus viviparus]